ncbi:unnamed protein product, partial [Prorocentrum cordatum]
PEVPPPDALPELPGHPAQTARSGAGRAGLRAACGARAGAVGPPGGSTAPKSWRGCRGRRGGGREQGGGEDGKGGNGAGVKRGGLQAGCVNPPHEQRRASRRISPPSSWTNEETTRARLTSNTFRRRVATSSNVTAAEIVEDTHASALPVSFLLLLLLLQLVGDELGT